MTESNLSGHSDVSFPFSALDLQRMDSTGNSNQYCLPHSRHSRSLCQSPLPGLSTSSTRNLSLNTHVSRFSLVPDDKSKQKKRNLPLCGPGPGICYSCDRFERRCNLFQTSEIKYSSMGMCKLSRSKLRTENQNLNCRLAFTL